MHLGNLILISKREVSGDFDEKKLGYPAVLRVSIQHQALQCPEFVKKLAEGVEGEKTSLKKNGSNPKFSYLHKISIYGHKDLQQACWKLIHVASGLWIL